MLRHRLAAAAFGFLLCGAAAADGLTVAVDAEIVPPGSTVTATVGGSGQGCLAGASIVPGPPRVLAIELTDACPIAGDPVPFAYDFELTLPAPGLWTIRAHEARSDSRGSAEVRVADTAVRLELTPDPATWADRLHLHAAGGSFCIYAAPVLADELVEIDLDAPCALLDPVPPPPVPDLSIDLPHLGPGVHRLAILDDGEAILRRDLPIYRPSPLALETQPEPLTDLGIVQLKVTGIGCLRGEVEKKIEPHRVVLEVDDRCDEPEPADASLFTTEVPFVTGAPGDFEVLAFEIDGPGLPALARLPIRVWEEGACVPSGTALCLADGRFRLEVVWTDFFGHGGVGHAVPLPGRDDTGLFWFFDPRNIELTVKVLSGCSVNGHWWVFVSSGSTVDYTLTVTDTRSDARRTYHNALGEVPILLPDTGAFSTCP